MGKTKTLPDYPRGLTFEDVWAALMETRERQEKDAREWREEHEKYAREWREEHEKYAREWREQAEKLDKQLGRYGNRYGEMIEYMVKPCLVEKFQELGFEFTEASRDKVFRDKKNNIIAEADFVLEDDDKVMLVEIKSKLHTDDIRDHIERMEKIRAHARLRNDNRVYLGAIGGMVIGDSEKTFALKSGFYVIEPSGETFAITVPEGVYSPHEW